MDKSSIKHGKSKLSFSIIASARPQFHLILKGNNKDWGFTITYYVLTIPFTTALLQLRSQLLPTHNYHNAYWYETN